MAKGVKTGGRDFQPGQSGNPSGHPKGFAEFRAACREHSPEALKVIVASLHSEDERVCLEAAKVLLERAWGKPAAAPEDLEAMKGSNPLTGLTTEQILAVVRGARE
jgi:hypothetical protein